MIIKLFSSTWVLKISSCIDFSTLLPSNLIFWPIGNFSVITIFFYQFGLNFKDAKWKWQNSKYLDIWIHYTIIVNFYCQNMYIYRCGIKMASFIYQYLSCNFFLLFLSRYCNIIFSAHWFYLGYNTVMNISADGITAFILWYCHYYFHDDIITWKHFPHYWPFVREIHQSLVDSHHKGQWQEALVFSLICAWTNGWASNRDAGDLRCHHAHCDVTVMQPMTAQFSF